MSALVFAVSLIAGLPPQPSHATVTTQMMVRATVSHVCTVSPPGVRCRGASGQPWVRVDTLANGKIVIEF